MHFSDICKILKTLQLQESYNHKDGWKEWTVSIWCCNCSLEVLISSHSGLIFLLNKKEVKSACQICSITNEMDASPSAWSLKLNTVAQTPFTLNIDVCGQSMRAECFDHGLFTVPILHVRDEGQGTVKFWQLCVTPSFSYSGKCPGWMFKLTSNLICINTKNTSDSGSRAFFSFKKKIKQHDWTWKTEQAAPTE